MHCRKFIDRPKSRREMLLRCANGFGAVALTTLLREPAYGGLLANAEVTPEGVPTSAPSIKYPMKTPHFPAKAKSVIFLYMDGGPSHMDTFDPKPRLDRENGQPIKMKVQPTQFNDVGNVLKSPWSFKNYGQSGIPVSSLFPNVAKCVDDMAIVRSMVSNFSEHTNANYFIHTGSGLQGRPSHGAWVTYGLGSECQDLPGFIVLNGGLIPPGGLDCFGNGFLPASYQGSIFRPGKEAVANISPPDAPTEDKSKVKLLRTLDQGVLARLGHHDSLESAIGNYELAYKMQAAVPDLMDLAGESKSTRDLYGLEEPYAPTQIYARQCLIARRLVERGVRFIELTCPNIGGDRWDQHGDLKRSHERNALAVDRPIAGLLQDLKARGLLDSTLVVWGGEFGRTPMAQGTTDGRDHNPFGFTMWLAGGGIKGGTIYGSTDEYGYHAVENKVEIHDLHATMLHLLGVDHKRLTYRFGGRDMRLTDVHGEIINGILA